jgi:hypothetical protein
LTEAFPLSQRVVEMIDVMLPPLCQENILPCVDTSSPDYLYYNTHPENAAKAIAGNAESGNIGASVSHPKKSKDTIKCLNRNDVLAMKVTMSPLD